MLEERDTLWHFVMSIVKYHESHYVAVLDRYEIFLLRTDNGNNSVYDPGLSRSKVVLVLVVVVGSEGPY